MNLGAAALSPRRHAGAMARRQVPERGIVATVGLLHDHLWGGRRQEEGQLLRRILRDTDALDRRIGARGALRAGVRPLIPEFGDAEAAGDLYTFLAVVGELDAAVASLRPAPRQAARLASRLAVSLSIHLASAADRFDLVREFEAGRVDFGAFAGRLADALEDLGAVRAGEFRRAVEMAFDANALWDERADPDVQRVAAGSAVASAGLASCLAVDALRPLGRCRDPPFGRVPPLVARILARSGGHP